MSEAVRRRNARASDQLGIAGLRSMRRTKASLATSSASHGASEANSRRIRAARKGRLKAWRPPHAVRSPACARAYSALASLRFSQCSESRNMRLAKGKARRGLTRTLSQPLACIDKNAREPVSQAWSIRERHTEGVPRSRDRRSVGPGTTRVLRLATPSQAPPMTPNGENEANSKTQPGPREDDSPRRAHDLKHCGRAAGAEWKNGDA